METTDIQSPTASERVYRKVMWRLMPVLFGGYILAYLDRVNVGFAKLGMRGEAWFSDAVFATGSGIFFIGYLLFEVPGNLILHRVGARVWITRIMVSWGLVSSMLAFSGSPASFYALRFLLGIAEAGFFPGIILYLTYWFPSHYRARIVAMFMTAVAFAGVFGSPLSGWILERSRDWQGPKPWQWLFLVEGVPSVLMGLTLPWLLTDRPASARWLTDDEKELIRRDIAAEEAAKQAAGAPRARLSDALRSPMLWLCCLIYFSFTIGLYGVSFWMPQIIQSTITQDSFQVGLFAAIPWTCAAIGMIWFGARSDRTGERRWHLSLAAWAGMLAFLASAAWVYSPVPILLALCVGTTAVMCIVSGFWTLPSALLSGTAMAAGLALVNSVGNLGGYLSPELFAWLKSRHGLGAGLAFVGVSLGIGGCLNWYAWGRRSVSASK
ncbi:MAG: MFS transporter [Chitinophagia bacterium]|nr:MFS transporter [Chitinophagia bacterium]